MNPLQEYGPIKNMRTFLLWAFCWAALAADTGKQLITATDLLKIRRITEVAVSPDASFAVYGVQSIHTDNSKKDDPAYSYRTHLYRIDLTRSNAEPVQLTFGERADSSIAISPDGRKLAFVRGTEEAIEGKAKTAQVWLLPLDAPGEAAQLTRLENGATQPLWRPDSRALLVTSATAISKIEGTPPFANDRPNRDWFDFDRAKPDTKIEARPDGDRRAIRNWLERNAARDNPTVITRMQFQDEQSLAREMRIIHLYSVDLVSHKAMQITKGFIGLAACSYSRDGANLVCSGRPESRQHPDRSERGTIWTLRADGSDLRPLLDQPTESFQSARYAADGKSLLVIATPTDDPMFRQSRAGRYDLAGKSIEWLGEKDGSSIQQMREASNGGVLFTTSWHGGAPLRHVTNNGITSIIAGAAGVSAFDESNGRIVYALISAANPNELHVRDKNGVTRQLTRLNSEWIAQRKIALPEERWITRPDGTRVQTWVMNPIDAQQGKKYPWVLDMHGGPSAMWGPGEFSMWHEFQMFCAWGYGVVYSNPRGSGGYGYAFQKANYKNWGGGPSGDVLAALDEAIKTNPLIDANRLFLTGGSYAGYLTAWIIGHDQRFKAAVAQRGVYDLTTFYGEGNAYRLVKNHFGGRPYEPDTRRLLEEQSPFTYASRIQTPFLIIHGSNDLRTGVTQSEMLYRALKDMGRPVEYIRYPNIGHELTRSGPPLQRMDHMLRIVEFFERYASNDAPAPLPTVQ
ncbi:MAG: S9 family peptidase [Acidobacteria bacterium]|nr:S9 family peptidase [Acidobacteriota bacterium]